MVEEFLLYFEQQNVIIITCTVHVHVHSEQNHVHVHVHCTCTLHTCTLYTVYDIHVHVVYIQYTVRYLFMAIIVYIHHSNKLCIQGTIIV